MKGVCSQYLFLDTGDTNDKGNRLLNLQLFLSLLKILFCQLYSFETLCGRIMVLTRPPLDPLTFFLVISHEPYRPHKPHCSARACQSSLAKPAFPARNWTVKQLLRLASNTNIQMRCLWFVLVGSEGHTVSAGARASSSY